MLVFLWISKKFLKGKRETNMADHILWPQTELIIPTENIRKAHKALVGGAVNDDQAREELIAFLEEDGLEISYDENVGILFMGSQDEDVVDDGDVECDSTLRELIGLVAPGGSISGYSDDGTYWQLRYAENNRFKVYGKVVFPKDSTHKYLLEIETA
jgi:hypothetical protein